MGLVYRARQESPSREVALKIVAPYTLRAEEARQRFFLEIETMAAIEHPAVLPLYQSGEDDYGRPWLTMQLLRGGSLADNLPSYQGQWKKSVELVSQLCDAIGYAHEHGLLHRDLKPANVLFDEDGNPFVADFGLAKWAEGGSQISQTSCLLGSPAYLAPETAEGGSKKTTTVSDVYGLGAILYELLTGRRPYEGESANEVLTQIISDSPPPPRKIAEKLPRDLEVIVLKSMTRDPNQRYHSAKALRDDLQRWQEGRPIQARPPTPFERLWLWAKRNPALATLLCLFVLSVFIAGGILKQKNRDLNAALDDAEDRVDFMVRDLPAQLAPIGRLEVLDSVFEDVAQHYENPARRGPESLARHADFQTQWSQILRPRALTDQSCQHLRKALALAEEACGEDSDLLSLTVVRARAMAGWRLGEVLIEDLNYPEAESILNETDNFLIQQRPRFPDDLQLTHIEAGLALEKVILLTKTNRAQKALQSYPQAAALWEDFRLRLEEEPPGPELEHFKVEYARVPYFLCHIQGYLGDIPGREAATNEYYLRTSDLLSHNPGNLVFQAANFRAQLVRATFFLNYNLGDGSQITSELIASDQLAQQIYTQDPGNVMWSSNSVHIAITLARLARKESDEEGFDHWLTLVDQRLKQLYQLPNTAIDAIRGRQQAAIFCSEVPNNRDWAWVRPHCIEVLNLQVAICRQTEQIKSFHNLRRLTRRCTNCLVENEGESGARQWLADFTTQLENEAAAPGLSAEQVGWWKLVTAFAWGKRAELAELRCSS